MAMGSDNPHSGQIIFQMNPCLSGKQPDSMLFFLWVMSMETDWQILLLGARKVCTFPCQLRIHLCSQRFGQMISQAKVQLIGMPKGTVQLFNWQMLTVMGGQTL